jgi:hypothetical protein
MNKITIIALVALLSTKLIAQSYTPVQKVTWDPVNSYITAGVVTALGTIVSTKYPVEITPQIGPSINWFRYDQKGYEELYGNIPDFKIQFGNIWGYSAGAMISTVNPGINVKSGLFIESKGRSYYSEFWTKTENYGYQSKTWVVSEGYSRLNYITIPLMIGIQTDGTKTTLSLDLGGFLSLPISEYHTSTTNGIRSDIEPLQTIGLDAGLLADIGIKIPISERISFRTDLRYAIGQIDNQNIAYGVYTQSTQLLLGISIRHKSK